MMISASTGPCLAVNGAIVKPNLACRELADLQNLAKAFRENPNTAKAAAKDKVAAHQCIVTRAKGTVAIDETRGAFVCIRPSGELECWWTPKSSVNDFAGYIRTPNRTGATVSHTYPDPYGRLKGRQY